MVERIGQEMKAGDEFLSRDITVDGIGENAECAFHGLQHVAAAQDQTMQKDRVTGSAAIGKDPGSDDGWTIKVNKTAALHASGYRHL